MIRLTPVTDSKARMLRPSRPMIRPFISSPGRCSTETTDSLVCSLATRWMARVTILRARFSAVRARLVLDVPDDQRRLALGLVLDAGDQLGLGLLRGQPGGPLQHGAALLVQPAELGAPLVQLPARPAPGQRIAARSGAASASMPLLALGQPGFPALQVAAELPDLVLDRPDLVLDLAARPAPPARPRLRPRRTIVAASASARSRTSSARARASSSCCVVTPACRLDT